MHENTAPGLRIRDLMPPKYTREIQLRTGCKQRQTIWDVVRMEQTGSKYWPTVLAVAKEHNPEGLAQWEAAQNQVQPAAALTA